MEQEIQKEAGQNGDVTATSSQEVVKEANKPAEVTEPNDKPKTFTQEQVNGFIRERLERDRNSMLTGYNVKNKEELDQLIDFGKKYGDLEKRYAESEKEKGELKDQMAFMRNNINPGKQTEIKALFKGLELEFNEENLLKMLETHPEWLNAKVVDQNPKTTFKQIGIEHQNVNRAETDEEKRARMFGD